MTINERFFDLLAKSGRKQREFSAVTGISEKTISGWKARGTDPPAELIPTIADFLHVSTHYLLTGEDEVAKKIKDSVGEEEIFKLVEPLSEIDKIKVAGVIESYLACRKLPHNMHSRVYTDGISEVFKNSSISQTRK